jgi:hypothetical protein
MKTYVNLQSYLENKGTDKQKTVFYCGYLENEEYQEDTERYDSPEEAIQALNPQ